jgi:NADP-dependent 3-hydroxy acid dehydrogenase YdfG
MLLNTTSDREQDLQGKVAVITGASQGIGQAVAERLAGLGVHTVLSARSADKLQVLAERLQSTAPTTQSRVVPCDVRDAGQVQRVVDETLRAFGRVDILVNNAGIAPREGLLQELSTTDIDRTIDTNLKGAIYFMRAVLPSMAERREGVIININSIAGKTAYPFWGVYDASKFGLHAVTRAVAEEQRTNGVKVAGIYPGAVDTALWDDVGLEPGTRREGMLDPEDVAGAVVYLLSQPAKVFVGEITLEPLKPVV